jgi:hypothetical protein
MSDDTALAPIECPVCIDPLREAADLLLLNGHSFESVAKKLERPPEFARALKAHLFAKHVAGPTRENYVILIHDYLSDARKMLERELQRNHDKQRTQIITLSHKAIQWAINGYARMQGLNIQGNKKISGDVIEALEQLAAGNPDAVKRIADARRKATPILTQAVKVEDPAKFNEAGNNERSSPDEGQSSPR